MVTTPIPRWLAALDEEKPYIEVFDGEKQPDVSPHYAHGQLAVRIGAQLDEWAGERGGVGAEVRFYFLRPDGKWSSLLPDVQYTSYARRAGCGVKWRFISSSARPLSWSCIRQNAG